VHRISWKLGGALLLVVLISVGLTAYFTNLMTGNQFRQYVSQGNTQYAQNVANELGSYYSTQQTWTGVQDVLPYLLRGMNDRLVIADSSGKVVGDTDNQWLGQSATSIGLVNGTSVAMNGRQIGSVYFLTSGTSGGMGQGMMGGMMGQGYRGGAGNVSNMMLSTSEQDFLNQFNVSLLISGSVALIIALGIGLIITRQITRPVIALNYGAAQIRQGNLKHRVKVKSRDEIGALADSFNQMAESLENGEKERRRIISDIAHEMRTPLTVIDGTIDAILDGVFQPDKERLGTIKEQTQFLAHVISDLRDLSLADSGQLKLEPVATDIGELVQRKLTQLEVKAKEKGVGLKLVASQGTPQVYVDPARIEQVVTNLLTNAIRHTPAGGNISVTVRPAETNQLNRPGLMVSVADSGEGIAHEHLSHIFERFYRVGESRSRDDGGAGLGLAIVKQMVLAHGGKVWAESEPGKGSTFFVVLPLNFRD